MTAVRVSAPDATTVVLRDGRRVALRAVRQDDAEGLRKALARLSPEARYNRFMSAVRELPAATLERAANPAGEDGLALVAVAAGDEEHIVGGARYIVEADGQSCEFAITVVDDWQRLGLASRMMEALLHAANARGLRSVHGYVLASNQAMLDLARRFGFEVKSSNEGAAVRLVERILRKD